MNTFKKEERLCSKLLINELLQNGSSFLLYPFRITWIPSSDNSQVSSAQILISVSKKRFKRANKRNRVKRLIREAYRLNKQSLLYPFLSQHDFRIVFMCSYIGNDIFTFEELEKKLKLMLIRLSKEIGKSLPND
ncbi:ribonuclease P protein component [Solitalea longa]|uniref:Ribonuclease P protein component n=1 Tax=Solitalea longa TaxID=2079460 RepID=A0A2S4ZZG5_9SPHI|nr:ribonuclease P protein component [Solitalea longa]POY35407.1 ribonuclease P protein component [Solitalea longa]